MLLKKLLISTSIVGLVNIANTDAALASSETKANPISIDLPQNGQSLKSITLNFGQDADATKESPQEFSSEEKICKRFAYSKDDFKNVGRLVGILKGVDVSENGKTKTMEGSAVLLKGNGRLFCITAAHCLSPDYDYRVGFEWSSVGWFDYYPIKKYVVRPKSNLSDYVCQFIEPCASDIAILYLGKAASCVPGLDENYKFDMGEGNASTPRMLTYVGYKGESRRAVRSSYKTNHHDSQTIKSEIHRGILLPYTNNPWLRFAMHGIFGTDFSASTDRASYTYEMGVSPGMSGGLTMDDSGFIAINNALHKWQNKVDIYKDFKNTASVVGFSMAAIGISMMTWSSFDCPLDKFTGIKYFQHNFGMSLIVSGCLIARAGAYWSLANRENTVVQQFAEGDKKTIDKKQLIRGVSVPLSVHKEWIKKTIKNLSDESKRALEEHALEFMEAIKILSVLEIESNGDTKPSAAAKRKELTAFAAKRKELTALDEEIKAILKKIDNVDSSGKLDVVSASPDEHATSETPAESEDKRHLNGLLVKLSAMDISQKIEAANLNDEIEEVLKRIDLDAVSGSPDKNKANGTPIDPKDEEHLNELLTRHALMTEDFKALETRYTERKRQSYEKLKTIASNQDHYYQLDALEILETQTVYEDFVLWEYQRITSTIHDPYKQLSAAMTLFLSKPLTCKNMEHSISPNLKGEIGKEVILRISKDKTHPCYHDIEALKYVITQPSQHTQSFSDFHDRTVGRGKSLVFKEDKENKVIQVLKRNSLDLMINGKSVFYRGFKRNNSEMIKKSLVSLFKEEEKQTKETVVSSGGDHQAPSGS